MCDGASILSILVEDDPVWTGAAAVVWLVIAHDRVFLIWSGNGESESFIVVILMRIITATLFFAILVQVVSVAYCCVDG